MATFLTFLYHSVTRLPLKPIARPESVIIWMPMFHFLFLVICVYSCACTVGGYLSKTLLGSHSN